jgi:aconitate hydratase
VIAESYERIHRSNLVGMGILPLQFLPEEDADTLGLNGDEIFEIIGLRELLESKFAGGRQIQVRAKRPDGMVVEFHALVRIDTPQEILYYEHGGILQYVLRQLLTRHRKPDMVGAR